MNFTHIIHIADLHIRTGDPNRARIEEYQAVFDQFLREIGALECVRLKQAVTVIVGDIFHNKGRIESAGFQVFSRFLHKLSELTEVFFICGNHDFRQEDPTIPDMLESMLDPWLAQNPRIKYLKESGHYEHGNIGFGIISVKDTLRTGNTRGIVSQLPEFPSVGRFSDAVEHRIALFHGTVRQCKLQNGSSATAQTAYPLEWFQGYDAVLLGDVHKQQIHHHKDFPWGYPGSLIQQDFGETIYGHGYLLWDLETTKVARHHVRNPFGMITLRAHHGQYEVYLGGREWQRLEDAIQDEDFPKRPYVRVCGAGSMETEETLKNMSLHPRGITVLSKMDEGENPVTTEDEQMQREMEQFTELCTPERWKEYLHGIAPSLQVDDWMDAPETMNIPTPHDNLSLPTTVQQKIQDRMHKITKSLHEYREAMGQVMQNARQKIRLHKVAWDYTLCYGMDNYFDFDHLTGKIALLNGRNASGKSSFLEMLCLGLFGEQTRTKTLSGKKMSAKIIHNRKPMNRRVMNIRILFSIENKKYEITREFGVQTDKSNVNQFGVELNEIVDQEKHLVREGTSAVNLWMEQHVGTMEQVLLSHFITQMDSVNFFALRQDDQKQLLERALHLESVTALANLIHEARLGHAAAITQVTAVVDTTLKMRLNEAVDRPEALERRIQKLEVEQSRLQNEQASLLTSIGAFSNDRISVEECDHQLQSLTKTLDQFKDLTDQDKAYAYEVRGARMQAIQAIQTEIESLELSEMEEEELDENMLEELEAELAQHKEARPDPPEVSLDSLERMRQEHSAWLSAQPDYLQEEAYELHALQEEVQQLHDILQTLREKSCPKPRSIDASASNELPSFEEYLDLYEHWSQRVEHQHALEQKRITCNASDHEYKQWQKKYKQWLSRNKQILDVTIETLEKNITRREKKLMKGEESARNNAQWQDIVKELTKEIVSYQNIPFNGECWACEKQPWRKHMKEKEKKLETVQKGLQSLTMYDPEEMEEWRAEIVELKQQLGLRKQYEEELPLWTEEYEHWDAWKPVWKAYVAWKEDMDGVTTEVHQAQSKLWTMWHLLNRDISSKVDNATKLCEEVKQYQQGIRSWKEKMPWRKTQVARHKGMVAWESRCEELQQSVSHGKRILRYLELRDKLHDLQSSLQVDEKRLSRLVQWDEATKKHQYYQAQRAHTMLGEIRNELAGIDTKLNDSRMQYGHAQIAYEKFEAVEGLLAKQQAYLEDLKSREAKFVELERWFIGTADEEGYKHWIYVHKVIPILQRELNRCLHGVEALRIRIEYEKGVFVYLVEDGDRKPSLDKASGYQNFIISLCMRITLGRIGATRNDFRQLIIDEGFTSCDADNLGKMPEFLQQLLHHGDYDSILLMSHLEGIRESATMKIDIGQEGPFSMIRSGDSYPVFSKVRPAQSASEGVEPVKKRGRPKKTLS